MGSNPAAPTRLSAYFQQHKLEPPEAVFILCGPGTRSGTRIFIFNDPIPHVLTPASRRVGATGHFPGAGAGAADRRRGGRISARAGYLLKRPVGRPPNEVRRYYANFTYQAASWTKPRRVIAKVEWHPGELVPRVGFIVTNMSRPAERVVAF